LGNINKGFGERLRALIAAEGITQKRLASEVGVTPPAVTFHLKGQTPAPELLARYASRFGGTVDYLLLGTRPGASGVGLTGAVVPTDSPLHDVIKEMLKLPHESQKALREALRVMVESFMTRP